MLKNNAFQKEYKPVDTKDHYYTSHKRKYLVADLIKKSKEYEAFTLPLDGIDLSVAPWGECQMIGDLVDHVKRMQDTNFRYPIILDSYGYICDGWHRVLKALVENKKTIKAIRLVEMPDKYEEIKDE